MTPPSLRATRSPGWSDESPGASVAVILLHGYGADERDLVGLIEPLGVRAPWASLRAPLAVAGTPGAAWFPIEDLGAARTAGAEAATAAIWGWIDAALPETTRILPIGFSQGGLMATQLLRTRPERVIAPVVLAGLVLDGPQPGDLTLAARRPAAFWGRGDADAVIPPERVASAARFLSAHTTLTSRVYPGRGHQISREELDDVAAFLTANAGPAVVAAR